MGRSPNVQEWLDVIERSGELALEAGGPYVRFGFPASLGVRKLGEQYQVTVQEHGDGASVIQPARLTLDRAELETYLEQFVEGGRPVTRIR